MNVGRKQLRGRFTGRRWYGPRWPLLVMWAVTLILGLGLVVGATVLGIVQGMQESAQMRHQSAQFHYEQGLKYLRTGQKSLALAEFQETLRLNPQHLEAQRQLLTLLLPSPTPIPTPTPHPTPTVNPDLPLISILETAREDLNAGRWQQAYSRLEQLRLLAPEFRPEEVTDLLYEAAYREGLELVQENRLEEALRAFDRALRWKPNAPDALRLRDLTAAYVLGISYFYADWDNAIAIFESLYRKAPDYKDVRSRYIEALTKGAEYHLRRGTPCQAVTYLARAHALAPEQVPPSLYEQAMNACNGP